MFKQARETWAPAMKVFEESYGGEALQTTLFASLHAELALASGDSSIAKKIWEDCLEKLATKSEAREDYNSLLFNSAALDENLKDYVSAKKKYTTLTSLLENENRINEENYKEAKEAISRLKNFQTSVVASDTELESILKKAISFQSASQTEKALDTYRQAEENAAKNNSKDKTDFSDYLNHARLKLQLGNINGAEQSLQKAKAT